MKIHIKYIFVASFFAAVISASASHLYWRAINQDLIARIGDITEDGPLYGPETMPEEPPLGGIETDLSEVQNIIPADEFIDYSSPFGLRYSPFTGKIVYHFGLDLYGIWHAQVLSPGDGVVIEHWVPPGQAPGYAGDPILGGKLVILLDNGDIVTLGHLSTTFVREGFRVKCGDPIARQGETGRASGEHVHFEVERGGVNIDPFVWFMEHHS